MKAWFVGTLLLAAATIAWGEGPLQTVVDDAWQGAQGLHFSGRVTDIRNAPAEDSGRMDAFYRTLRLLFTSGEKSAVTWRVAGNKWTAQADRHGYWELTDNQTPGLPPGWHDIVSDPAASSPAALLVVDPRNPSGIISDIDDTILVTGVLSKGTMLKNSLTVTPEHREAVAGMAQLYQKLVQKNPAPEATAVFYLSGSPRQLTDNVRRFLTVKGFPRGVLQLKEIAAENKDSVKDNEAFKLRHIETIFAAYPQIRFYLFGDDGERDPEIYAHMQKQHPAQVIGIWIHHVNPDKTRPTYPGQRDVRELLN